VVIAVALMMTGQRMLMPVAAAVIWKARNRLSQRIYSRPPNWGGRRGQQNVQDRDEVAP
jgi:hypothetical protein